MITRGSVWWADLGEPRGSRPAKRRPVLIVSADGYNRSELRTVVVAAVTSNTELAARPGNVFLPASSTGLPRDSAVNVTALMTVDRDQLTDEAGAVPPVLMSDVDRGLRMSLDL